MSKVQCNACGGVYEQISADSVPYAHVCGPVTRVAIERDGVPMVVDVADVQGSDVITVVRNEALTQVRADATQRGDRRIGDTVAARVNARNENPPRTGEGTQEGDRVISAPGLGVSPR